MKKSTQVVTTTMVSYDTHGPNEVPMSAVVREDAVDFIVGTATMSVPNDCLPAFNALVAVAAAGIDPIEPTPLEGELT